MIKRTLNFLSDAGHAWLSVSLADLRRLGIVKDITNYSYMNGSRAYLEEDIDAFTFINAAKKAGWVLNRKESQCESTLSWVRNLSHFTVDRARIPIELYSVVEIRGHNYRVVGHTGKDWLVMGGPLLKTYRVSGNNPFSVVDKVVE